jgi:dolichol kinase
MDSLTFLGVAIAYTVFAMLALVIVWIIVMVFKTLVETVRYNVRTMIEKGALSAEGKRAALGLVFVLAIAGTITSLFFAPEAILTWLILAIGTRLTAYIIDRGARRQRSPSY